MKKHQLQFIFGLLIIIAIAIWAGFFNNYSANQNKELKVYFLDVGQGDSEYIKMPNGQDILIDGGPDSSVLQDLGNVMDIGDREINLVILTHPHADHLTGLVEVLKRYKIDEIWESGVEYPSATYDAFKNAVNEDNISDKFVTVGMKKKFGEIDFKVLYPLSSFKNKRIDNLNNASVVTQLLDNKVTFLFMGDAEAQEQKEILPVLSTVTVVKVSHHGSVNGLLENFYKITRPAVAIIEVGKKNTYGHPSATTINLLKHYAIQIYRTDQDGTVEVDSDGVNYHVVK